MDHAKSTESDPYDYLEAIPAMTAPTSAPMLTDANLNLFNDFATPIEVSFSNERAVDISFGSSTILQPTSITPGSVSATAIPEQSRFTVQFASGETMVVDIGSTPYSTSATPSVLQSGKGGAMLAPGRPLSASTDYDFFFLNGPGICTPLANGLIQVWLPIVIQSVTKSPLTLYTNSTNDVTVSLTDLQIPDLGGIRCDYASVFRPLGGDGELTILNSLFSIANTTATFNINIKGVASQLKVQVQDLMIYLRGRGDLSLTVPPTIDALKFSLGDYNISGDYITTLEIVAPLLYELLTEGVMDAYRLAGLLNNNYNQNIINVIDKIISGQFDRMKSDPNQGSSATEQGIKIMPTGLPGDNAIPSNGCNSWMTNPTIQALTLGNVKLPGTHDSPTYVLEPVLSPIMNQQLQILKRLSPGPGSPITGGDNPIYVGQPLYDFILGQAIDCAARAQDTTITTQLANGIRYFDLRLYFDEPSNSFNYQHTIAGTGFSGILDEFAAFLQTPNTTELVFVLVSNTNFEDDENIITSFANLIKSKISQNNIYFPASQLNFDLDSLADTPISSITNGSSKIMFMYADDTTYAFPDTVVNCQGFPQNPWSDRMVTPDDLVKRESNINDHTSKLWGLRWSLDANLSLLPQFVVDRLGAIDNWLLQSGASLANPAVVQFLKDKGGANAKFNLLTCDWFETPGTEPLDLAKLVISMNGAIA